MTSLFLTTVCSHITGDEHRQADENTIFFFLNSFPDTNSTHILTKRKATGRIDSLVCKEEKEHKRENKNSKSATKCNNTACQENNALYRKQTFMNTVALLTVIKVTASKTSQQRQPFRGCRYEKKFCTDVLRRRQSIKLKGMKISMK